MNILAIDTSSTVASAAILSNKKLLAEYNVCNGKTHSQIIMPMISDVLDKAGLDIADIDVFATALGPGSFTGLRIGVATAKTLAQATGKKVIGISSLHSLSANVLQYDNCIVCPIVDARRGNVFNAIYKNGIREKAERLISVELLLKELNGQKTVFVGDGCAKYSETIKSLMGDNAVFLPEHISLPRAASVAHLAEIRAADNEYDDLYSITPIYVRNSQAERELNGETDEYDTNK
ncbi:MAG: tRNA (adenosine(37)-N6)-threonylcarbamoyltransferase complex dimerization subunit type 1 TsaB [Ruminococcaceae bacterium]|nr:tRNA (adenosine(37)-N6)-threonylcarbamoyltransferase complex dimerization subunit type 1 TsaB [Oscillospiraceae bacterium]